MKIRENVLLSELTTMRLGGPARFVVEIEEKSEIEKAFAFAREKDLPFFILGGGANTIGKDAGFYGVIVISRLKGLELREEKSQPESAVSNPQKPNNTSAVVNSGNRGGDNASAVPSSENPNKKSAVSVSEKTYHLTAYSGEEWDAVVELATKNGLTGIEALSKIPGLAGAAPVQNIGAYGQDVADTFVSAEVYDTKTQEFKTLTKADFEFGYRKSILNTREKNRYFIISIDLILHPGQMERPFYYSVERLIEKTGATDFSPAGVRELISRIRADKLPDPKERASAGSFFKNVYLTPEEAEIAKAKNIPVYEGHDGLKINSGWLIERCGLAGKVLYGFRVNEKAALVLINESAHSYADLQKARTEIREKVLVRFGYYLEQEPIEI